MLLRRGLVAPALHIITDRANPRHTPRQFTGVVLRGS